MRRIVSIEIDFGGDQDEPPNVRFKRTGDDYNDGYSAPIWFHSSMGRLERATAGWPAYVEIDNQHIILDRPGYDLTVDEYESALSRIEKLMDMDDPQSNAELLELAERVERYERRFSV